MYIFVEVYVYMYAYTNTYIHICVYVYQFFLSFFGCQLYVCTKWVVNPHLGTDGVAMIRRLLKNIGRFCRI